jgi:MFS superfamily sulfate permease-like transporter
LAKGALLNCSHAKLTVVAVAVQKGERIVSDSELVACSLVVDGQT